MQLAPAAPQDVSKRPVWHTPLVSQQPVQVEALHGTAHV
jgi:hypothetical protein